MCRIRSQRPLLAIAGKNDCLVYQVDVRCAFPPSPIEGEVYVKMTPGPKEAYSKTDAPMVMKLKRSLYGLAQSSFPWYGTIDATLLGISFTPTASRPHAYTCWRRRHVGDPHPPRGRNLTQGSHPFKEGACGPLCHDCHGRRKSIVFGISIARDYDKRTLTISQEDCVQNAPQEWFWYNRVQHSQHIWIRG